MAADTGEIRVRQRPLVMVEQAVISALWLTMLAWAGPGWEISLAVVGIAVLFAVLPSYPTFVADAEGIRVPNAWMWWRRRYIRWDQIFGVRLVPSSIERPGRRIELATVHGWVAVGAPRDGWLVRDDRLEGLVDQLWRRVPPTAPPAQPLLSIDVRGVILFARCAAIVVVGVVASMATERLLPALLGPALAIGYWLLSPRVDVDDHRLRASRGSGRRSWAVRWDEVRAIEVVTGRFGRRRIEVVGTERHALPAPRDGLVLRDPRIDGVADDLRSRIPLA